MNTETEEEGASEKQNEVLEFPAPTFQRLGTQIIVADADETDHGDDVGGRPQDAEDQDADGGKGHRKAGHLNERSMLLLSQKSSKWHRLSSIAKQKMSTLSLPGLTTEQPGRCWRPGSCHYNRMYH